MRTTARRLTVALLLAASCGGVLAAAPGADLTVAVRDRDGHAIAGVVVALAARAPAAPLETAAPRPTAVMDQHGLAFVPQILVIATGTEVRFPNSDDINHQVYSFSKPKTFQLPLYKGRSQPPVLFDRPGLVVLGCNIHDEMVGYIYVADGPYFGQTGADGTLTLHTVPEGDYRLDIWGPRIVDAPASLRRELTLRGESRPVEFRLSKPLKAAPAPRPPRPESEY